MPSLLLCPRKKYTISILNSILGPNYAPIYDDGQVYFEYLSNKELCGNTKYKIKIFMKCDLDATGNNGPILSNVSICQ